MTAPDGQRGEVGVRHRLTVAVDGIVMGGFRLTQEQAYAVIRFCDAMVEGRAVSVVGDDGASEGDADDS